MSPEAEATDNATNQVDDPPAKRSKLHKPLVKETQEVIRARKDRAIASIPSTAKKDSELYQSVVHMIETTSFGRKWIDTGFYRTFINWCSLAGDDDHPELAKLLATLAVYDAYGTSNYKFNEQINRRRLREWAAQKLKERSPTLSTNESTSPKAPKVKMEEGVGSEGMKNAIPPQAGIENRGERIRQSIEFDFNDPRAAQPYFEPPRAIMPPAAAGLLKRQAPNHSAEQAQKRVKTDVNHETFAAAEMNRLATFEPRPQRIVLRDSGTQTDSAMFTEWAISLAPPTNNEPVLKAIDDLGKRIDALEEKPHAELPGMIRETIQNTIRNSVQNTSQNTVQRIAGDVMRYDDSAYGQQVQIQPQPSQHELVPIQPVRRQPTAYFYEATREPNNGSIFRFG